jgi:hypothetical protein
MEMNQKQIDDLLDESRATHDAVIRLETKFNGGPGNWAPCKASIDERKQIQIRLSGVERRIWMGLGGLGVLIFILDILFKSKS